MWSKGQRHIRMPLKKKHEVWLLDFVPRPWSFFSTALVAHWLYIWLLPHVYVLAKVPKTSLHIQKRDSNPLLPSRCKTPRKLWFRNFLCPRSRIIAPSSPSYNRTWKQCESNQPVNNMHIYCSKDAKLISLNWNWDRILRSSSAVACPRQ